MISVSSPPPMGECFTDEPALAVNQRLSQLAELIRSVVAQVNERDASSPARVSYLPLFESIRDELLSSEPATSPRVAFDLPRKYGGSSLHPLFFTELMLKNTWSHFVNNRSWDDLAQASGLTMTHDMVHLTERGAAVLVRLLDTWIKAAADGLLRQGRQVHLH